MKNVMKVVLLAVVVVTLVGCASSRFGPIGKPYIVGDNEFVALEAVSTNPFGANATSVTIVASNVAPQSDQAQPKVAASQAQQPAIANTTAPQPVLTNTHVVNSNNQGSNGCASGALQGVGEGIAIGGGMAWGASLVRPSRVNIHDSGSTASAGAGNYNAINNTSIAGASAGASSGASSGAAAIIGR